MQQRNIIIIGVAVLLGLVAVYLANSYFSGVEEQQARVAEEQQLVRVAVAAQDLEFGSPLTSESVRLVNWPAQSVPPGAITDLNRFQGTDVAIRPIAQGEPILVSRISERAVLSENIPEDMRAMTIPVSDVNGVAGFVTPGDVVDIIMTRALDGGSNNTSQQITSVVMENVQVLAIDKRSSENSTEPQSLEMATMLVDQYGAQKLALATRVGSLSLALRNVENQNVGSTEIVTMADIPGGLRRGSVIRQSAPAQAAAPRRASADPRPRSTTVRSFESAPSGPSMLIYRGTEGERREVPRGSY